MEADFIQKSFLEEIINKIIKYNLLNSEDLKEFIGKYQDLDNKSINEILEDKNGEELLSEVLEELRTLVNNKYN